MLLEHSQKVCPCHARYHSIGLESLLGMADVDKSSKTEPPTEKKLSEARSKGQFAKAPEIGMTAQLLLAGLLVLFFLGS